MRSCLPFPVRRTFIAAILTGSNGPAQVNNGRRESLSETIREGVGTKNAKTKGQREFSHAPGVNWEREDGIGGQTGVKGGRPLRHGPVITWSMKRESVLASYVIA